jgi:WD40 repeat protein
LILKSCTGIVIILKIHDSKFRFVGHDSTIKNIMWKCNDDVMAIECTDSRLYLWQVNTGHLDRIERDAGVVDDILVDFDWGVGVCNASSIDVKDQKTFSIDRRGMKFLLIW